MKLDNKIGIGISTYKRYETLKCCLENFAKWNSPGQKIVIVNDGQDAIKLKYITCLCRFMDMPVEYIQLPERMGVAKVKNKCLELLEGYAHVFLFDDDCFPIRKDWSRFFIDVHEKTRQHHFLRLGENKASMPYNKTEINGIELHAYLACNGCFMYISGDVLKKVGGFSEKYTIWGYEHVQFSDRVFKSGLNTFDKYIMPKDTPNYIFSLDLDDHLDLPFTYKFKSSISEFEKEKYEKLNRAVYRSDEHNIFEKYK
jgi:GT2 family glycosyltransferase